MASAFGLRRLLGLVLSATCVTVATCHDHWVDIWASMPQQVEPYNLPNPPYNGTDGVFQNTTIRQTVYLTQDASTIRLQFSNAFGNSDLPITAATIALPVNGTAGSSAIHTDTVKYLTFSGSRSFQVPNGALVVSDPLRFPVKAQTSLTITVYLAAGQAGFGITGHPGSRTSSWLSQGNLVAAADLNSSSSSSSSVSSSSGSGTNVQRIDKWFLISAVQAWLPPSHVALAIVGDSITDGRGSTTNGNDRWPDRLLARLQKSAHSTPSLHSISVLNMAAGGNRILVDGLGPNALGRIERDVLAHPNVRYAIVFEGVNDLGMAAADAATQKAVGDRLIQAYDQMVARLHGAGIAVFGATITPMSGPSQAYGDPAREAERQRVNRWIRTSGRFDAVVDFDAAVRDPKNGTMLRKEYDSGDYLHLNPAGYKAMTEAVDLRLFARFAGGSSAMV
ncbi:SGNH hydrolase-type esterase domain-containing protein [Achaetomium macrosporum]|uniref:SGNH hydrolase-type esterase domain-containing protein n=1 Tax=Achaetomium macrosporum TaxID=79813 RepID=A0AAN7HCQ8_9PEZI|nr:SGNH hydrolase-type esterase domain-containing protein [Achaetomium macrosporum]